MRIKANDLFVSTLLLSVLSVSGCTFLDTPSGRSLMDYVVQTVVLIATPIVLILLKKVINVFEVKTGLNVSAQQISMLDEAVRGGIAYAEEQARKAAHLGKPLDGEAKRNVALDFVVDTLKKNEAGEYGRDYLTKLLEAKLNQTRAFFGSSEPKIKA